MNQEKKKIAGKFLNDLGDLKPQEIELIHLIRNTYKFGEITIETRDGIPHYIVQTIKRKKLGDFEGAK